MREVPFIKLLKWHKFYYFFDVNRNQLLKVTKEIYEELEREQNGLEEEHSREYCELKEMGFLSSNKVKVIRHPQTDEVEYLLNNKLSQLTLQVTQDCNFRCSYCIYSELNNEAQRNHTKQYMSFEIAKKAIDYLYEHSYEAEKISIGFYGGEPLLAFDLVKKIVDYVEPLFIGRNYEFAMTSNCSLLTEDILEFLENHNFHLMISMDGMGKIQNRNRRFALNGRGSFDLVIKKVLHIKENRREWFDHRVGLSMVMNPRDDYDDIIEIFKIFNSNQAINAVSIGDGYSLQKTFFSDVFLWKQKYHQFLAILELIRDEAIDGVSREARQLIDVLKKELIQYIPIQRLPEVCVPTGPCVAGQNKLLVTVDGELFPCEKVSEQSICMRLGSVEEGVDPDISMKMMNFAEETADICKNCWAFLHCGLCIKDIDNNGALCGVARLQFCSEIGSRAIDTLLDFACLQEIRKMSRDSYER